MSQDELSNHARSVIDSNRYMALGTADEAGHPWEDIGRKWGLDDVQGSALVRLYRATALEHWVLIGPGSRARLRRRSQRAGVDRLVSRSFRSTTDPPPTLVACRRWSKSTPSEKAPISGAFAEPTGGLE